MQKNIAQVVVPLPLEGPFDYSIPEHLQAEIAVGSRVQVSFSNRKRVGFVVGFATESKFPRLNSVLAVLDEEPAFDEGLLRFADEFALHFGCTKGEALELFLPAALRKSRKLIAPAGKKTTRRPVRKKIENKIFFDEGFTQRWDYILPRVKATLDRGESVICLAPDNFVLDDVFPRLAPLVDQEERLLLSHGVEKEELEHWRHVRFGDSRLIAGYISAVLAPMRDLGLILIFDEESPSYKHDQSPFYHAREAAYLRAGIEGCDVVAVTSAPSLESWHRVVEGEAQLVTLKDTVAPLKLIDLTNFKMKKDRQLSPPLCQELERGGKVLLYVPAARGTADVVKEVRSRFPNAKVFGYEKTSTALPRDFDVLVATQAIFRHRATLRFALSAVLDIDWEFHKLDYRAAHGAFTLVQHLRQMTTSRVLLQTRHVENENLHDFVAGDHEAFFRRELASRKEMGLPPFAWCVAIVLRSADPKLACEEAKVLYDKMCVLSHEGVELMEPQQDRSAIVRGKFRYCVMAQGKDLPAVMTVVKEAMRTFRRKRDVVVTVNVNP
jgi:primosomal protein N'